MQFIFLIFIYWEAIYQEDSRVQPNFYNWRQIYSIFYLKMTCMVRNTATFSLIFLNLYGLNRTLESSALYPCSSELIVVKFNSLQGHTLY